MKAFLIVIAVLFGATAVCAQALFAPFMANSSGGGGGAVTGVAGPSVGGFFGQVKPTGPIELNRRSPFAGLVNLYDRGDGWFIDGASDNPPIIWALSSTYNSGSALCSVVSGSTAYGTASLWPGACVGNKCAGDGCSTPYGIGITVPIGSVNNGNSLSNGQAISIASGLGALGAGAGYSFFMSFIWTGAHVVNDWGWYGGRTWISSGENYLVGSEPLALWGFAENMNPVQSTNYGLISAAVTTGTTGSPVQSFVGSYQMVAGTYYEMSIDCVNTSSGSATCEFMVNGVYQSNLTSVALPTPALNQSEMDIMIGANTHTSGLSNHIPAAYILKLDFIPRHLTRALRVQHWLNPWSMFQPKGSH